MLVTRCGKKYAHTFHRAGENDSRDHWSRLDFKTRIHLLFGSMKVHCPKSTHHSQYIQGTLFFSGKWNAPPWVGDFVPATLWLQRSTNAFNHIFNQMSKEDKQIHDTLVLTEHSWLFLWNLLSPLSSTAWCAQRSRNMVGLENTFFLCLLELLFCRSWGACIRPWEKDNLSSDLFTTVVTGFSQWWIKGLRSTTLFLQPRS